MECTGADLYRAKGPDGQAIQPTLNHQSLLPASEIDRGVKGYAGSVGAVGRGGPQHEGIGLAQLLDYNIPSGNVIVENDSCKFMPWYCRSKIGIRSMQRNVR